MVVVVEWVGCTGLALVAVGMGQQLQVMLLPVLLLLLQQGVWVLQRVLQHCSRVLQHCSTSQACCCRAGRMRTR